MLSKTNTFIQTCQLPMMLFSTDLLLEDVNQEAATFLGISKLDQVHKSILDLEALKGFNINAQTIESLQKNNLKSCTIKNSNFTSRVNGVTFSVVTNGLEQHILGVFHQNFSSSATTSLEQNITSNIEDLLSKNPDLHYIADLENKEFIYQNVNVLEYFGYEQIDLKGQNVFDFLREKMDPNSKQLLSTNLCAFKVVEFRVKTKQNNWIWIRSKSSPLIGEEQDENGLAYVVLQDITQSKEAVSNLKAQKTLLRDVATLIPDLIQVFDLNSMENIFSNFTGRSFLGYTEADWSSKDLNRLRTDFMTYLKRNEDRLGALGNEEVITEEFQYSSKAGPLKWLAVKSKVFKRDETGKTTQVLSVFTDINAYKESQAELAAAQKTTKAIIHAIPDLLLVINKKGFYEKVIFGRDFQDLEQEEIVGKHINEILESDLSAKFLGCMDKCFETGEAQYLDFQAPRIGVPGLCFFSNCLTKINDDEVLVVVRDETEKNKAKINLDEKIRLLSVQNEQLGKFIMKNAELERFAYIISHDLKEPLRSINAISELISLDIKGSGNEKLELLLDHLSENSTRMISLIEGVLSYSKIDNHLYKKEVDLDEVLQSVLMDLSKAIKDKSIIIEMGTLGSVLGDEIQLRQLFINLIGNAIKFNDADAPKIIVRKKIENGKTVFQVSDNGIGISEDFKKSIFKMFKRVHKYTDYPGQGLGLSICRKIVERHDGEIWVEDNVGKGASFCFTLE